MLIGQFSVKRDLVIALFWTSLLEGKVEMCCRENASPISPPSMVQ